MDVFTVLTPLIVIAFLLFLTLRLIIKFCKPSTLVSSSSSSSTTDTQPPDFTRVANHLFVSNTPHTFSRIYVDEASNVRSVTITRISPPGQHIVG
uniref:Transmembrane protein n=1 Tax=Caenorhabditis tropicalis TaxID=1561998 RepID=A0A1I7UVT4_9PELO